MERLYMLLQLITTHTYITAEELATQLHVTSRTVRNDLYKLNELLNKHGANIEMKPRHGNMLQIYDQKKYECFFQQLQGELKQGSGDVAERIQQIIEYLINAEGYVKIDDLCEMLYVSRSTLSANLKLVRKRLDQYQIKLIQKPNYGLKIEGDEINLRLCIAHSRIDRMGEFQGYDEQMSVALAKIGNILEKEVVKYTFEIADFSFQNLVIHIYIAIHRIKAGYLIPMEENYFDKHDLASELEIAASIVSKLEETFEIEFPQCEQEYISIHLGSKKIISIENSDENNTVVSAEAHAMVLRMLEVVNKTFKLDFSYDIELITLLALHLIPLSVRMQYNLRAKNPLLGEIKSNYMLAYNLATVACETLKLEYNKTISDDEIAYIALHFNLALERKRNVIAKKNVLVVCGSGRGSAELIAFQVREKFGDYLNVVKTYSSTNLSEIDFDNIDYIMTTVSISERVPVPIIEVKNFLQGNDLAQVHTFFNSERNDTVLRYYNKDLFFANADLKNKYEVLTYMVKEIAKVRELPKNFLESILKRESVGKTEFGNLVSIPHPYRAIGKESFVSVLVLKRPIIWDEERVQVVFLLSVKESGDDTLHDFYRVSGKLFMNKIYIERLVKKRSYMELENILKEITSQVFPI